MKKLTIQVRILLSFFIMTLFYNNCDSGFISGDKTQSSTQVVDSNNLNEEFVEADFLKEIKPNILCGKDGYSYLLDEYFSVHCTVCHTKLGGFQPYFADSLDKENSYYRALYINEATFKDTLTNNRFCGHECSLNKEGETYQAIVEWLDNKWSCP